MEFFGEDNRFSQIAHWTPQTTALASQIEIGLLLGQSVAMLQNTLRPLDDFARFKRAFHFECLGNQSCIFESQSSLPCDGFRESHFFRRKRTSVAGVDVQRSDYLRTNQERNGKKRCESRLTS